MQSRHTSKAIIPPRTSSPSDVPPTGESTTRLKSAETAGEDLRESVKASIAAALDELESLELPINAPPHDSLEPPRQMPKGMPPVPFGLNLPSNMPPLPPPGSSSPEGAGLVPSSSPAPAPRRPFSTALVVTLAIIGFALVALAVLWRGP